MAQPTFSLYTDSYATELEIKSIAGSESISKFFELKIEFKVKKDIAASLDHLSLTQDDVYLKVEQLEDRDDYSIKGIFKQVEEVFEQSNTHKFYVATMVPALWRQRKNQSYDIYTNVTVENVLTDELSNDLMLDHHLSLTQTYPTKEFICQYSESNFDFVCRMSEHWGIYYYFDHDQDGRLVFADDTNYEPLAIPTVKLDESNNPTNSFNSIRSLRRQYNSVPDAVIIAETNPDQAMELFQGIAGEVSDGKTSVNMADEGADNKDEAELLAQIRLQELQAKQIVFTGTTGLPCITPGFVLTVELPDGDTHEILITDVSHNGQNLDDRARAQDGDSQPYYECTFSGIPKETQYRPARLIKAPAVISTTGRVYSAADDQTLAQRNEVGKYQVTFDFMKGEEDKISSWIRHASHASRSNHFDIPLIPGTEVQIGFIGGNPNRPYILNALENSQSVIHPVTHENPHHAAMITDGMFYTGALKSRQSLHMTADLDPTEVKDHINNHPLKHLDKQGVDSGNPVDTIKGDVHIARTYGERYQWREGVDFNYGLNATYNFGQQYVENHAYQDTIDGEDFDVSGKLDSFDDSVASIVRSDLQSGLAKEREVGFVQKDFGNKYNYHEGVVRNWAAGMNGSGHHVEMNFGGRYIENQLKTDSGMPDISGLNGAVSDTTLAIKTVGDEARYNDGLIDVHHEGDMAHIQTGNHTSEITGDVTTTVTSGTATVEESIAGGAVTKSIMGASEDTLEKTITGDITETITAAGKMAITITAATEYTSMITAPTLKQTTTGNMDWIKSAESQLVLGMHTDNFMGAKFANSLALVSENFAGVKMATYAGPKIDDKKIHIRKSATSMDKGESFLTDYKIGKLGYKLTLIG